MTLFTLLKIFHSTCALLSIGGFAVRGYWAVSDNPRRNAKLVRVLPHVVDTLLLATAIGMLVIWQVSPFAMPWLGAKLVALVVYIGLGVVTMRIAKTPSGRKAAYTGALLTAAYILSVAVTKSALGPLQFLAG
ncbi:regulator SirB [Mangrovimicrobium sediminis]|uniref:Regulator SirB n=1 Tax=Mangrovimicrobium sediminis TaxID=2562682 RepID=A0A4Z0LZW8_9GAMM|nr:SirB2 family protein [Haliea sp. SAOS-164]TGD72770.1 regulator SirB [Haliea sp. SAOS-164]